MAGGLLGIGQADQNSAIGGLGMAATDQTNRTNASNQLKEQHTQSVVGDTASGAAIGTMYAPGWGTAIGGAIGFITGELT